ncbi:MAG: nucleotidyltransferase family protein [Bacteroidales bacterium]|nr:nucleotidyltransferase family protein [Bacteroidales bacterium]
MLPTTLTDTFLQLVRLGVGAETDGQLGDCTHIDWIALEALAARQGLSAIVLDGLDKVPPSSFDMPRMMKRQWIGRVVQGYEYRFDLYCRAIAEMAAFYRDHGFKMMVLKGYACALNWPKPEHRPSGDIDIWQFGQYREADAALASEKGISVDSSHHHHTVFYWGDFMVENHYDFINVHHHKSNAEYEKILKKLGEDDSFSVGLYGEKVYLPSPNLHVLFLLKHSVSHFASGTISLRQLLDWGFFVKVHSTEINWQMVQEVVAQFGMEHMLEIFNRICVEDLGFAKDLFPEFGCNPLLKNKVLNEILSPEFTGKTPASVIPRIIFRYRRWRSNEWKHQICYKESMWSAFWSGVWNHLLKPSSI